MSSSVRIRSSRRSRRFGEHAARRNVVLAARRGSSAYQDRGQRDVGAQGGSRKSIPANTKVSGYPAREHSLARKIYALIAGFPSVQEVGRLSKRVDELEKGKNVDPPERTLRARSRTRERGCTPETRADVFHPAPPSTGIRFAGSICPGGRDTANVDFIEEGDTPQHDARRAAFSCIREHILASASGLQVDNLIVDIDSDEPPERATAAAPVRRGAPEGGVREPGRSRAVLKITTPVVFQRGRHRALCAPL